jgi:IMP dehydrogenase
MKRLLTFDDVQILPKISYNISRDIGVDLSTQFTKNYKIQIPLIAAPMDTVCGSDLANALMDIGGVGILHRFNTIDEAVSEAYKVAHHGTGPVASSIGATGDFKERAVELLKVGVNVLLIDVAHGHHINVKNAIEYLQTLRTLYSFDIIAGNIATERGYRDLCNWGADAVRAGVGGGSACETRLRTGIGVPQWQMIYDIHKDRMTNWSSTEEYNLLHSIPLISDGGIRYPGDVAKALAAGAESVMLGSLFSGTDESPGEIFVGGEFPTNKMYKMFRGSASATIKMEKTGTANHVEGASKMVEMKGSVKSVVKTIMDGVTSCMSYVGATNLNGLKQNAEFIEITQSGIIEARPHMLR